MNPFVKTILNALWGASVTVLCSCVSPVHTDYDREAVSRFEQYSCFEIVPNENQENDEDVVLGPIVNRRIERELSNVLKAYGFTDQCASPDFRVQFQTAKKTVTRLDNFGVSSFYGRSYGCSVFDPYSNIHYYPRIYVDQYEEGTFLVDIIDAQLNEVVWRGAYVKRLGLQAPTDSEIRSMLNEILERFPPEVTLGAD